jgi:chromosome segregation ATPase
MSSRTEHKQTNVNRSISDKSTCYNNTLSQSVPYLTTQVQKNEDQQTESETINNELESTVRAIQQQVDTATQEEQVKQKSITEEFQKEVDILKARLKKTKSLITEQNSNLTHLVTSIKDRDDQVKAYESKIQSMLIKRIKQKEMFDALQQLNSKYKLQLIDHENEVNIEENKQAILRSKNNISESYKYIEHSNELEKKRRQSD